MVGTIQEAYISKYCRVILSDKQFNAALDDFACKDAQIIPMSELAYARTLRPPTHSISQTGSYVREGILFVPKSEHPRILLKKSLVLEHPKDVVLAHKENREYLLDNFDVNNFLAGLNVGKDYLLLDDLSPVPFTRLGEDARTVFLLGEHAKDYGLFLEEVLKDEEVTELQFYMHNDNHYFLGGNTFKTLNDMEKPFIKQLCLAGLRVDESGIMGSDSFMDKLPTRGIKYLDKQAISTKSKTYNSIQVKSLVGKTLNTIGIKGKLKDTIISDLEKRLS